MKTCFGKICAAAREAAGYTQEAAAEMLNISVRSLSDYERGQTQVPGDIAARMMDIYHSPYLGYMYLQQTEVGRRLLPSIEMRQLSAAILDLQVEMNHVNAVQLEIAEVGRDNKVDEREQPRWQRCAQELKELAGSLFSVLLAPMQKEKTACAGRR